MRALLDTHAFLWWITGDERLSDRAAALIAGDRNEIYVSAATVWEMAIKARLGRLAIAEDPAEFMATQMRENLFRPLPMTALHAVQLWGLPLLHRDPFDRMLIAQAQAERMALVTADEQIGKYPVKTVW